MPALSYDEAVDALMRQGVPFVRAHLAARKHFRIEAPSDAALAHADEDAHVDAGDKLMLALGFEVVRLAQKRASKITPGVPDRKYYHRRRRLTLWWEAKAKDGKQRNAQREFQVMAEACGETYVLGKLEALKQWVVDANVAYRSGDIFEPTFGPHSLFANRSDMILP